MEFSPDPSERCLLLRQAADQACTALHSLPADVAEWTLRPAGPAGKPIWAEFLIDDLRHPLRDLAARLRAAADEVDRLLGGNPVRRRTRIRGD